MSSHLEEIFRVDANSTQFSEQARAVRISDHDLEEVLDYELIEDEPRSRVRPIQTTLLWTGSIAASSKAAAYEKALRELLRTTQFFDATVERVYADEAGDVEVLENLMARRDGQQALLDHVAELQSALARRIAEDDGFITELMREHERALSEARSRIAQLEEQLSRAQALLKHAP